MKKIEKRAVMCLLLAGALVLGIGIFTYRYVVDGGEWATFSANRHVYSSKGMLIKGAVYDRNGTLLMRNAKDNMRFNEHYNIRKANVHLTGDRRGNISTGANKVLKDKLVGYNLLSGTYSLSGEGRDVALTIDADLCATANKALYGRRGTVGVYNYKTGEILCLVSSPNYDPKDPPSLSADDDSGTYINRFFSATFPPGSIFKLVTAAASIENKDDYASWEYHCTGHEDYGPDKVTCTPAHGTVDLQKALSVSCNCYFGKLTEELGPDIMEDYVKALGLTEGQDVSGITTAKSTFEFPESGVNLAWSGIGQYKDLVNPCGMMTYMGAIANDGVAVEPKIVENTSFLPEFLPDLPGKTKENKMIDASTATTLKRMMRENVEDQYGAGNFPGLNICAKSGTAEVSKTKEPNAWFSGFLNDENHPYAFIVLVENGGYGSTVAGRVANTVLQELVD